MYQREKVLEPTLNELLEAALGNIQVDDDELEVARDRRDELGAALRKEFPGSKVYLNGSVAHGDALTPLTDVDVGVIVAEAVDTHGPGKRGPLDLMERAADAIRDALGGDYDKLAVKVAGQSRAVLVRFGDPVTPGQVDFTADVLVTVDNTRGQGLFIPNVPGWDRSDPEGHTAMVKRANRTSKPDGGKVVYARVVRLLKHWCRQNGKPLCSWNIKALALGCLTRPMTLVQGLETWFEYALKELSLGPTPDPAGVAPDPIAPNESLTRVRARLVGALEQMREARRLEEGGYFAMAHKKLADLFNDPDMLAPPDQEHLLAENKRWIRDRVAGSPGPALVLNRPERRPDPEVDAWRP